MYEAIVISGIACVLITSLINLIISFAQLKQQRRIEEYKAYRFEDVRKFDMKADKKLRGRVIAEWENAGKPSWGKKETTGICLLVNAELKAEKLDPSPKFRKAIEANNLKYVKTWVLGCHFSWLNPR